MKKYAWIIGASTGIGKALALKLIENNYIVAISARSIDLLEEMKSQYGENLIPIQIDVTKKASIETAYQQICKIMPQIDLAILSAGSYYRDNPYQFNSEIYEKTFALNVFGVTNCLEKIIPHMIAQNHGQIGIISSVAGINGLPLAAAYGGSKAALINICESLCPALKRKNIDLSLINPGFVDTPLTAKNDFAMPFIISAEKSAQIIIDGLNRKKFEIIFPFRMSLFMKLLKALPYSIKFYLSSKILKK